MNRRFIRLLAAPQVFILSLHAAEPPVYDLDHCVRAALSSHPSLTMAQKDVEISDARRRAATVGVLSAVSLKASETKGKADDSTQTPSFLERSYGAQVTQPLFAGGRLWASRRQALLGADIARLQLEKTRLDVLHSVNDAYWRAAASEKSLSLLEEAYAELQSDLEKAVRRELGGNRGVKMELLSVRAANRDCEAAMSEEKEALIESQISLRDAMGERRDAAFRVQQDIPEARVRVSEEEVLRLAREHRPENKIAAKLMDSARMARRISKASLAPRVDLNGFYGRSASAFIETDPLVYRKDWNAGVTVSWPIFGSTARYNEYRERTSPKLGESTRTETDNRTVSLSLGDALSSDIEAAQGGRTYMEEEWRFEKARRDMEKEALLALRRVETAWARLQAASARASEAGQQFTETSALLRDGRAHLGDIASARSRLAMARSSEAKARAQHRIALSALNRSVGVADLFGGK